MLFCPVTMRRLLLIATCEELCSVRTQAQQLEIASYVICLYLQQGESLLIGVNAEIIGITLTLKTFLKHLNI